MRPFGRSREPLRATLTALTLLALSLTLAGFAIEKPYLPRSLPLPESSPARGGGGHALPLHMDPADDMPSIHRFQEMLDSMLANLAAVFDPFLDCFAKMKPDQDA
jgi:hypothetical protein